MLITGSIGAVPIWSSCQDHFSRKLLWQKLIRSHTNVRSISVFTRRAIYSAAS